MRAQAKYKKRESLPNQIHKQQASSLNREQISQPRRLSLPISSQQHPINIRNSIEVPSADIYFNIRKKSKFMKNIVDNYFQQTLQKIYGAQQQIRQKQNRFLQKNRKSFSKGVKMGNSSTISISEDQNTKQEIEQDSQNMLYKSLSSSGNLSAFLPSIYESQEDNEAFKTKFPDMNEDNISNMKDQQTSHRLIFENQAFKIFIAFVCGKPKYRVKQFKNDGRQLLKREQKVSKFGVQRFWKQSTSNALSLVSQLTRPLKNIICKIIPNIGGNVKFKVLPASFRKILIQNNCYQLKLLIKQICLQLKKVEGKVLNNKINPSNIFIGKNGKVSIGQWGSSSFREQYKIQQGKYESRIAPLLRTQRQWLATPQYLSPELLHSLTLQQGEEQFNIWQYKSSSDIWSLGLTLFQILTIIPIWMPDVCQKFNTKKPTIRTGLLGTSDRKIERIIQKQTRIQRMVKQCFQLQADEQISNEILNMISRMIIYDPSKRITLDDIIAIVK